MSIEIIQQKNSKKYRSTLYLNGKRKRSKIFKRKVDAIKWEERQKAGFNTERIPTFKEAAGEWIESHCKLHNKVGTLKNNEVYLKELTPIFGSTKLSEIKTKEIEAYLGKLLTKGLAKNTLKKRIAFMKSVYNWHMNRGLQVFNPCRALGKLKIEEPPVEHWSIEQANQFLEYTEIKYCKRRTWIHLLYLIALNTGLRWGEIIGLDWSSVDLKETRIAVKQVFDEKLGQVRQSTKSGRVRYVGINEALYQPLALAKGKKTSGLIFQNLTGQQIDRWNFRQRYFYKDMKEAKVPKIKFHSLRHTYATAFMSNGGNIFDLQKLLGHSTLAMTDRYAHFSPDHASQRANVVNLGRKFQVIEGNFATKKQAG